MKLVKRKHISTSGFTALSGGNARIYSKQTFSSQGKSSSDDEGGLFEKKQLRQIQFSCELSLKRYACRITCLYTDLLDAPGSLVDGRGGYF